MKYLILIILMSFLAIVVYNMAGWIIISSEISSFEEAKALYTGCYPQFMRSAAKITLLNMVLSALAGIGLIKLQHVYGKAASGMLRLLAWFAFFLAVWQTFSLL
ncbi:MAG: hypothetical protein ABS46_18940 [Cytophagaceae bacterium SCN 52-12]|nr:MAG: hypothetical protein ABS46_18940 [Cytophagaceae bacterium SCN 52-12]